MSDVILLIRRTEHERTLGIRDNWPMAGSGTYECKSKISIDRPFVMFVRIQFNHNLVKSFPTLVKHAVY